MFAYRFVDMNFLEVVDDMKNTHISLFIREK